jgi:preprotein translocase subunit SecG
VCVVLVGVVLMDAANLSGLGNGVTGNRSGYTVGLCDVSDSEPFLVSPAR